MSNKPVPLSSLLLNGVVDVTVDVIPVICEVSTSLTRLREYSTSSLILVTRMLRPPEEQNDVNAVPNP